MADGNSRRGEVLWPVGLHVEVMWCDLDEQVIFRGEDIKLA